MAVLENCTLRLPGACLALAWRLPGLSTYLFYLLAGGAAYLLLRLLQVWMWSGMYCVRTLEVADLGCPRIPATTTGRVRMQQHGTIYIYIYIYNAGNLVFAYDLPTKMLV